MLVKANPFFLNKNNNLNKWLDEFFTESGSTTQANATSVNIAETDDAYLMEVAAPGMKKEDFNIKVEDKVLTISATKETKKEEKSESPKYLRREFSYSNFSRGFQLGDEVDVDSIKATYDHGILHVSIPKKEEAKPQAPKKIEIA